MRLKTYSTRELERTAHKIAFAYIQKTVSLQYHHKGMGKNPRLMLSSMRAIQEACSFKQEEECAVVEEEEECDMFPSICHSPRLFFSPSMTKSIMEEARTRGGTSNFFEESVVVVVASADPCTDFRASMAEMVEAHGLRGWEQLQELLRCYLRLNEEKDHGAVAMAFVDLVAGLMASNSIFTPSLPVSVFST